MDYSVGDRVSVDMTRGGTLPGVTFDMPVQPGTVITVFNDGKLHVQLDYGRATVVIDPKHVTLGAKEE